MSLFASLGQGDIWALSGISFASAINDILDREDFTLEELLEEDELIQEVKSKNESLIEYLCKETTIDQLISFIVHPTTMDSDLRRLKYPYMSCEVICCEIPEILSHLVELYDGKYLQKLFTLLDCETKLDNYLAGYFEKILEMLFRRMTIPLMQFINNAGSSLLVRFLRHMDNYSVMQIVQRLMLPHIPFSNNQADLETTPFEELRELYQCNWSYSDECCALLLDGLFQSANADVPLHVSDLLITVLQLSPPETLVIKCMCATDCLERLLAHCCIEDADTASAAEVMSGDASMSLACMSVLESLVSRLFESSLPFDHQAADQEVDSEHLNAVKLNIEDACVLFAKYVARVNRILRRYIESNPSQMLLTQGRQAVPRLGHRGLQLVKLVESVVRFAHPEVDAVMCSSGLFQTCLELFYHFRNNSLLHLSVQRIFVTVIESDYSRRATQLFVLNDCNLMSAVVATVSGYVSTHHPFGGETSDTMDNVCVIDPTEALNGSRIYGATTHSSIMGNAVFLAQALSLLLEVDAQGLSGSELLSDMIEREFATADERKNTSVETAANNPHSHDDRSAVSVVTCDSALADDANPYRACGENFQGNLQQQASSTVSDFHMLSIPYPDIDKKDLSPTVHSLRCSIPRESLARWDLFVDEKLRPILEHQTGGGGNNGGMGTSGVFSLDDSFAGYPIDPSSQDGEEEGEDGLKLGVDLDLDVYRVNRDSDEDDEDEDGGEHHVMARLGQQQDEDDVWGDYFAQDGPMDDTDVVKDGLEEAAPVDTHVPMNESESQSIGAFDFAGFADFDSFNTATEPLMNADTANSALNSTAEEVVEFADFANFS